MDSRVTTVTPAMAGRWLEDAAPNRSLKSTVVDRYARDMLAGKWQVNGSSIVISSGGQILDGQHRLHACVKAGTSFRTLVIEGVDTKAFETIDSGVSRTGGDVLHLLNYKYAGIHAAALALLFKWDKGQLMTALGPTREEMLATNLAYPQLARWVELVHQGAYRIGPAAIISFVACIGAKTFDDDTSELFVNALADGVGLTRTHPVRLLREKLIANKGRAGGGRLPRNTIMALCIKAYAAFARDEPLAVLRWSKGEPCPNFAVRFQNKRAKQFSAQAANGVLAQ